MVDYTPYAQALFELALSVEQEKEWMEQLDKVSQVFVSLPEFKQVLAHPSITREKKKDLLQTAFEKEIDQTVFRFLLVLNEHDVVSHIDSISEAYKAYFRKAHNIEIVRVTSATSLDVDQLSRLKAMLEKKLNKTLELEVKVDPSLIAGIKVQAQDLVMDNSIVSRIAAMKEAINR